MKKEEQFKFTDPAKSPDYLLWQVYHQWQRSKNDLVAEHGITGPQLTLLASTQWLVQNGKKTIQSIVAETANMDPMTASTTLRTLQKKGLITRKEDPNDTRSKSIQLTPKGNSVTVEALEQVVVHNAQFFGVLKNEKTLFTELLYKLLITNKMQKGHLSKTESILNAPVNIVWEALTNPDTVELYFFGTQLETDWDIGSPITWTGEFDGQSYRDKGIVLEFIPLIKTTFSYLSSWSKREDKPENYLFVSYELREISQGTKLTIIQSNYDEEGAIHSKQNWQAVIDEMKKIVEHQNS